MNERSFKVLAEARQMLDKTNIPLNEKETLIKLIGILTASLEKHEQTAPDAQSLAQALIDNHALLSLLNQQTEELDALKKLSINLTSSLDLPEVLDALVSEAMQLIPNARDVHIFLYKEETLSFGAALDSEGNKNEVWSKPRKKGLTYTIASTGKMIIVEDMQNHPLFANAPKDWSGSIIGIPLKVGTSVVGVMNMARSIIGGFSGSELRLLPGVARGRASALPKTYSPHEFTACAGVGTYSFGNLPHPRPIARKTLRLTSCIRDSPDLRVAPLARPARSGGRLFPGDPGAILLN
jgi:PIN domain nuclease of toxin-antitoxin system